MRIIDINLEKITKDELIKKLFDKELENPTSKELKVVLKNFESSIKKGVYNEARNALIIGIFYEIDLTIDNIQRKGLFRYSKYKDQTSIVKELASELIELIDEFNYKKESITSYLESIINLSATIEIYKDIQATIDTEIASFEEKYSSSSLIKTLLCFVDYLFLINYIPENVVDKSDIKSRAKEELCTAVSYIIYYFTNSVKYKDNNIAFVNVDYMESDGIKQLLSAACLFFDLKEFEVMIDHFKYTCKRIGTKLKIEPVSVDFEKSIRLGYIRTEIQKYNDFKEDENILSLEQITEEIYRIEDNNFFTLTESHGYQRYTFKIPEPILETIIDRLFIPDELFKEEFIYLAHIFKEQLLCLEDLKRIKIRSKLSLFEFIKVRRIFLIFYHLFSKKILKEADADSELIFHSLIPSFNTENLYNLFNKSISKETLDAFFEVVSWQPSADILFDLQYHPVIFLNKHYLIPLSIIANSNSLRNLYASEYKQHNKTLLSDGTIDSLVEVLHSSFCKAGIISYKETTFLNTDIDLFAVFEDTLFLFECKHTIHPINVFDLRTTYDYVRKAERQLDLLNEVHKKGNLISILEHTYSIDLSNIVNIQSSIILSNRIFNGNVFKYSVRNINELKNMLNSGTIKTNEGEFRLWQNNQLSSNDLLEYLSLDSKLFKMLFNSLSKGNIEYRLNKYQIELDSYFLDLDVALPLLNNFTSNLQKTDDNEINPNFT